MTSARKIAGDIPNPKIKKRVGQNYKGSNTQHFRIGAWLVWGTGQFDNQNRETSQSAQYGFVVVHQG